jgi:hypothetical protein
MGLSIPGYTETFAFVFFARFDRLPFGIRTANYAIELLRDLVLRNLLVSILFGSGSLEVGTEEKARPSSVRCR